MLNQAFDALYLELADALDLVKEEDNFAIAHRLATIIERYVTARLQASLPR